MSHLSLADLWMGEGKRTGEATVAVGVGGVVVHFLHTRSVLIGFVVNVFGFEGGDLDLETAQSNCFLFFGKVSRWI